MTRDTLRGTDRIAAEAIGLRPVREADLPILFEHQRDPVACEMAAFPARAWKPFLAHWTKILADPAVTAMAVVVAGGVAGYIVSWEQAGRRLVGYWLDRASWGRGVATAALAQYLQRSTARPLFAFVAKHNLASIRVLEKCGFAIAHDETAALHAPKDGVEELVMRLGAIAISQEG